MQNEKSSLDIWKELMDKFDLLYFREFQAQIKPDLEHIRAQWKAMRIFALKELNTELNNSGASGQLLNIDVSDDELYPYMKEHYKQMFFKYSRMLDFSDGYKPKGMILITKGLPL